MSALAGSRTACSKQQRARWTHLSAPVFEYGRSKAANSGRSKAAGASRGSTPGPVQASPVEQAVCVCVCELGV